MVTPRVRFSKQQQLVLTKRQVEIGRYPRWLDHFAVGAHVRHGHSAHEHLSAQRRWRRRRTGHGGLTSGSHRRDRTTPGSDLDVQLRLKALTGIERGRRVGEFGRGADVDGGLRLRRGWPQR